MNVSVLQDKLSQSLSSVSRVVSSRPSLPILSNVLLTAKEGGLELTATDLNLGMHLRIGARVKKEGAISVPAKVFGELVASLSPTTVELFVDGDSLRIQCAGYKARLSGIAATEFPSIGKIPRDGGFRLPILQFREAVSRVSFAASSDETRPVLSGVLWRVQEGGVQLVATDGYRLSTVLLASPSGKGAEKWSKVAKAVIGEDLVVPARALRDVERLADELGASEVGIGVASDQRLLVFQLEDGEVTTRLIEGAFPNFSQVIPKEEKIVAELDRESLTKAVRAVSIFARDSANIIHWKLEKMGLTISANAPSFGESESTIDVSLSGGEGEIAFNSRYLLELLSIFPSEKVMFTMNGGLDPGVFWPKDGGKESFLHLIMPVRVQK